MSTVGTFTERVRQELAGAPVDDEVAEVGVLLRLSGQVHRVGTAEGSRTILQVTSPSGAVIRRVYRLLPAVTAQRPQLWVREPSGVRHTTTYGLVVEDDVVRVATQAGLFDADGRPLPGLPAAPPVVLARGAILTVTAMSDPGRPVHLEVRAGTEAVAQPLQAAFDALGVALVHDQARHRLVAKSGPTVTALLELVGAPEAAAELEERRGRRALRSRVTALANADAANVNRTIEAAQRQIDQVNRAVAAVGWSGLGEDLRALALSRLVNPDLSLAELGQLADPPVSKSAVHRRMARIAELAEHE